MFRRPHARVSCAANMSRHERFGSVGSTLLFAALTAGCVNVDPDTGETIPRGDQRYHAIVLGQKL